LYGDFYVAGNCNTYSGVFPILTVFGFSGKMLFKSGSIKSHGNPSSGIRTDTDGQTDERT